MLSENFERTNKYGHPTLIKTILSWYHDSIHRNVIFYVSPVVDLLYSFFLPIYLKILNFLNQTKNTNIFNNSINEFNSKLEYNNLKTNFYYDLRELNNQKYSGDIELLKNNLKSGSLTYLPEYNIFLNSFSRENRVIDVTDTLGSLFMCNAWFDFTNPASLEYRGIVELYHFVMLKLLFIFLLLIIISVFLLNRINLAVYSYKLKNLIPEISTKSIIPFIFFLNKKNLINNNIKNYKYIYKNKDVKYILNRRSVVNITNLFMPVTY